MYLAFAAVAACHDLPGSCNTNVAFNWATHQQQEQHQAFQWLLGASYHLLAAVVSTCCWTSACMVLQLINSSAVQWLAAGGVYTRTHHPPSAPTLQLLASDLAGVLAYVTPQALVQLYMPTKWSYAAPNIILVACWAQLMMLLADT